MPGVGDPVADRLRAGGRALLLLADPASVSILRQLSVEPLETVALFARVDGVSRSIFFDRLRDLEEFSLISRERQASVPPVTRCRLAGRGRRLLDVASLLEAWLARAPGAPLGLDDASATLVVKALALGWGSTLLRWLAERPRSLSELERLVGHLPYRKLERMTHGLAEAGLVERVAVKGRLNPYTATRWGRESAMPFAAAIRWEQREMPERCASVTALEAEGVLLMVLPLVEASGDLDELARLQRRMPKLRDGHCADVLIDDLYGALLSQIGASSGRISEYR